MAIVFKQFRKLKRQKTLQRTEQSLQKKNKSNPWNRVSLIFCRRCLDSIRITVQRTTAHSSAMQQPSNMSHHSQGSQRPPTGPDSSSGFHRARLQQSSAQPLIINAPMSQGPRGPQPTAHSPALNQHNSAHAHRHLGVHLPLRRLTHPHGRFWSLVLGLRVFSVAPKATAELE